MTITEPQISFEDTKTAFAHYSKSDLNRAHQLYRLMGTKSLNSLGKSLAKFALAIHFPLRPFVKSNVFEQFCGGETLEESKGVIEKLEKLGVESNLNYGVELKSNEEDFERSLTENISAISFASENEALRVISCKVTALGFFEVIEKKQRGEELNAQEQISFGKMKSRINELCEYAASQRVKIYWDAEESWVQGEIDTIVDEMMACYNKEEVFIYNTFQMYRHDRLGFLQQSLQKATENGYKLGAKLVRGAYMEQEREWAAERGLPSPIQVDKAATDKDYDAALRFCIENIERVSVCVASHNEKSTQLATELMQEKDLASNHPNVWFSQLYGMGEHITFNLAAHGYNATKYIPYGPIKEVIPYLIRRADENSSVDGQMGRELQVIRQEIARRRK